MKINRRQFVNQCKALAVMPAIYGLAAPTALYGQSDGVASSVWDDRKANLHNGKKADEILLTALGDMIWTRELTHFDEPEFRNLYRLLQDAEITYGNLEMSLNERPDLQRGLYNYGKDREFAWEIAKLGVNLVSLANNHAFDFGMDGFRDTLRILDRSGISYAGGALTLPDARQSSLQQFGTTRFSLLSYYSSAGATSTATGPTIATINAPRVLIENERGVAEAVSAPMERDVTLMENAIRNAKARADIVIVHYHLHWVSHSRAYPIPDTVPPHQHPVMYRAIDAGADIIVGNGPHVLRGIEIYKGKPIFYSLGNFIYQYKTADIPPIIWTRDQQQDIQEEFQTIVPRLTVRDKKISRIELIPCELEMSGPRTGCPKLASDKRGNEIFDLLQRLSRPYGTRINKGNWYATIDI